MTSANHRLFSALRIASIVMAIQAFVVIGFGVVELFATHRDFGFGVGTSIFFIAYGVGIGVCGWGILDLHRWARGPTLLIELMNLCLAWSQRDSNVGVAWGLAGPALVVLICILLPSSVEALEANGGRDKEAR